MNKSEKISQWNKKRWSDPVFKEKMRLIASLRRHSEKSKNNMSKIQKDRWVNLRKDPIKFAEFKKKISETSKGRGLGKVGELAHGWKGGRYTTKRDKYIHVWCPEHPNAKRNSKGGGGYVLEHRLVMEKMLGRILHKDEDVHHINGKKDDNRIENLMLVSHYNHYQEHGCPGCGLKFFTK